VAGLDIRPLDPATRDGYAAKWAEVQERFVDAPGFAVTEADQLVAAVMSERGYPTEGFEQRLSDLSVAHGRTLDHYRQAHEISGRAARREATTEELRQAMVHYRALFEELLVKDAPAGTHRPNPEPAHDDATHHRNGNGDGTRDGRNGSAPRHAAARPADRDFRGR
jgi:hypothetical protein